MAAKKKNAETVETTASNVIAVDARKLCQGLKMTFEGMALVFDSIGVDAAVPTMKVEGAKVAAPADTASAEKAGVWKRPSWKNPIWPRKQKFRMPPPKRIPRMQQKHRPKRSPMHLSRLAR